MMCAVPPEILVVRPDIVCLGGSSDEEEDDDLICGTPPPSCIRKKRPWSGNDRLCVFARAVLEILIAGVL